MTQHDITYLKSNNQGVREKILKAFQRNTQVRKGFDETLQGFDWIAKKSQGNYKMNK